MDQKILIRKIQKGQQDAKEAFEDLYNQYSKSALRVAYGILKEYHSAMDAVEETFIRVYYNINKFNASRSFNAWFYKILTNECYRIIGKKKKIVYMTEEIQNKATTEDKIKIEEYDDLYKAIENLDEQTRTMIVLKYIQGFKEKELAYIMNIKVNTVKTKLRRGKLFLKELLLKSEGGKRYAKKYR